MRRELGKWGEDIAVQYLQQQGYRIIARNYRMRCGEIDIICGRDKILVFVEVKTRSGSRLGCPEESVTAAKQKQIRKLALAYIGQYHPAFGEIRFDVIGILVNNGRPSINHVIAAF